MSFEFKEFQVAHVPLFRSWLAKDHIKKYWQETDDDEKLKEKFLSDFAKRGVSAFIILRDGVELGYIQYYDATKVGGGWWEEEAPGTFGIDLMIGLPELVGKGVGPKVILEFIRFLQMNEPSCESVIIDPDPGNSIAIRAFEKAGFHSQGEVNTPGGRALLMRKALK